MESKSFLLQIRAGLVFVLNINNSFGLIFNLFDFLIYIYHIKVFVKLCF